MKKLLLFGALLLALGVGVAYYMWNKPKKSASSEEVFALKDASELYDEFFSDQVGAIKIYIQKNIEVRGIVEAFSQDSSGTKLMLRTNSQDAGVVTIDLAQKISNIPNMGDSIVVRGLCVGFNKMDGMDMLGGEVLLNQGVIIK